MTGGALEPTTARILWHRLETLNAVAYFSPECIEAAGDLGLRGFWMGYFACRAAPMGPVAPGVVEAAFANFHPDRVRRAIPEAWAIASPDAIVERRAEAAADALRRLLPRGAVEDLADAVVPVLREVVGNGDTTGRTLFAANQAVPALDDPVADLWQAATSIREHRGDGHVALLTTAGLDGCRGHVLFSAAEGIDPELYLRSRGWTREHWDTAMDDLRGRGYVSPSGEITSQGRALRDNIEQRTDELAAMPWATIDHDRIDALLDALGPGADRVAASGEIMFPNPMGLPTPARASA